MRDRSQSLHEDPELLAAVHAGEVPWRELRHRRRRHLDALCGACALRTRHFAALLRDRARTDPATRGRCYAAVADGWFDLREAFEGDLPEVERDLTTLRRTAPGRRAQRVRRVQKDRFRSPLLAEALIEESRGQLRHHVGEALGWLETARAVTRRAAVDVDSRAGYVPLRDLRLRIRAHQANSLRVRGELRAADDLFRELADRLAGAEPPALAVSAELASLEASLRYDQRRLEVADGLLERAERFYRWAEDRTGLVKVQIKRGMVLYAAGEPESAIRCYEAAVREIDADAEPQLAFNARHNLVLCLCAVGKADAAAEALQPVRKLAQRLGDPTNATLLRWAEGKVAAVLGEEETALVHLGAARAAYNARVLAYDGALVGLDIAEIHLSCGDTTEVKRLAEEMAAVFSARDVAREAARAVAMFAGAAVTEALTLEIIARTRAVLLRTGRGEAPNRGQSEHPASR